MIRIHECLLSGSFVACLVVPMPGHAETGTMEAINSLVPNYSKLEFGDSTLTAGGSSGTITVTKSSGSPFVEGMSGLVQCIVYAKKSPAGLDLDASCTISFSPEDKLFWVAKRRSGDVVVGASGEGAIQTAGGTGRFAGMSGQCTYKIDLLEGNHVVTMNKCQWRR